jgi:phosphoribosylamine---glycine ligase
MKVLVVGSGGREHAICYAFSRSPRLTKLYCANGNAGIASVAECVAIRPDDIQALADFASANAVNLTFVGGETSLALGIVDEFAARGLRVIGPTQAAAQLESSKAFAKDFMARHKIPTAKHAIAYSADRAKLMLEGGDFGSKSTPVVVKADGLAAGKGVVVAQNRSEAVAACDEMGSLVGEAAADKIVLEECLVGREVSLLAFVDGENFALMPPVRDHKRIGDGDTGPNTGGMGTITDSSLLSPQQIDEIVRTIIRPTLRGSVRDNIPFRGILFLGLMMTGDGPKALEYNVRFGDPETQAIIVRLNTDLIDICEAMLSAKLNELNIDWHPGASACVVLASEGYPAKPRTGDKIIGLDKASLRENVVVFHAGTSFLSEPGTVATGVVNDASQGTIATASDSDTGYATAGGRVLGVTSVGADLQTALNSAYAAVSDISWPGMQYRRDIGR